jgi:hypothetical protein
MYNRPGGDDSSGGDSGLGPALRGGPDPRDPMRPPGVTVPGKNFAPRPELVTSAPRGQDGYTPVVPGSSQWTRGANEVLNKQSFTTRDVAGPRRRHPK